MSRKKRISGTNEACGQSGEASGRKQNLGLEEGGHRGVSQRVWGALEVGSRGGAHMQALGWGGGQETWWPGDQGP